MTKQLKIGTLFSGIGAFEQAVKRSKINHKIVFANDIDKYCKQSYDANYKYDAWYDDIVKMKGSKYKNKIDILVGGSPCQSFSIAGERKGLDDPRGKLIEQYIRIVKEIQPKVFIFENVKGLLTLKSGKVWNKIIFPWFKSLNYDLYWKVLNAKDYGIPQNRNRLFLIGFKDKCNFSFPKPIKLKYKMVDFLDKVFYPEHVVSKKAAKGITNTKRLKKKFTQVDGEIALCQARCQEYNLRGDFVTKEYLDKFILSDKLKKTVLRYGSPDPEIAKTILSSSWKYHYASRDNYVTVNKSNIRRLTPRECLRLMGFPESFKIVVNNTQIYKQSGNSIVVDVLFYIFKNICKVMRWE